MKVLGFTNETAYYNGSIDALPAIYAAPKMVSSNPENESFELNPNTLKSISVTYDKELNLDDASATLYLNGVTRDYTENMTLSADKKTINVALPVRLSDNEYTMILSGVKNSYGVEAVEPTNIIFAIGKDKDNTQSEVVYQSDFDNDLTDGVPPGWNTYNEAGYHLYGFNDEDRTSQYTYNYGGNPGGGGTRLYAGFSGDFKKAMYWGSRGTPEGYAEYGSLVKDYIQADGTLSEETPEDIVRTALWLEPRKYNISFLMAAWKGEPTFTFTLEDLEGNIYARFEDYLAAPNVNGVTSAHVTGSVKCEADFIVDHEGYYVLRFTAAPVTWQEYLLANVELITMPSKASYWKSKLAKKVEEVGLTLDEAANADYDGETKTALTNAMAQANAGGFTSGTQISTLIAELDELNAKMKARIANIDSYSEAVLEAQMAIDELDEKYQGSSLVAEAQDIINRYKDVDPKPLSDGELAEVAPALTSAMNKVKNAKSAIDYLTYGVQKAAETAALFGADPTAGYNAISDDRALADNYNTQATIALYKKIANGEDLSAYMTLLYDTNKIDDNAEEGDENYDEEGHPLVAKGIDLTGFIQNPNFYTMGTTESPDFTGWIFEPITTTDGEGYITTGSARMTAMASADNPVNVASLNAYGASAEYNFYQAIRNLPVGVYTVYLGSRTAVKNQPIGETDEHGVFNAQNEDGIWDKYIYAQVGNAIAQMTPFAAGSNDGVGFATTVTNVIVKKGEQLTIGAVENYTSGKASGHNWNFNLNQYEPTDFWDTNTYVRDAKIFFVAPLEGYDYAKAARDLENESDTVKVLRGDANGDQIVDIIDVVTVVNYILQNPSDKFNFAGADVNGDQQVDIVDVVGIINIILGGGNNAKSREIEALTGSLMTTCENNGMNVLVDDAAQFAAMQFDVIVPDDATLLDATLNSKSGHQIGWTKIGTNRYRVLAYSLNNANFEPTEDALMKLVLSDGARASIEKATFVTADGRSISMNIANEATGIELVDSSKLTIDSGIIYNLAGQRMGTSTKSLPTGVYIRNGKKIKVK